MNGSFDGGLVEVESGARDDLATLFEVRFGCVARKGDVFDLGI